MQREIPFLPADILIPGYGHEFFSTIACDQFTSEPKYWEKVSAITDGKPSAYHITLPEIYLSDNNDKYISAINKEMRNYLENGYFTEYKNSMIYVERTLPCGKIRRGIVGAIDLEKYDYTPGSEALIRATEGTVPERIPPRVKIRKDAPLELPHVMLLIDDPYKTVIEPLTSRSLDTIYDFDMMTGAGRLKGKLIPKPTQDTINSALKALAGDAKNPLLFAVGDGNHSLATAKECYINNPNPKNRYALAEIVNIHDSALSFEPIYRVVFGADTKDLAEKVQKYFEQHNPSECSSTMSIISANKEIIVPCPSFPVGKLQQFLEKYIRANPGTSIDYIHGLESIRNLAKNDGAVGFIFEGISKNDLFPYIKEHGVLPRKSFSMGEALDKRFYMECRKIK